MKGLLFFKLVALFVGRSSAANCDVATTAQVQEGNFGQSGDFNWLGVLHVNLYEEGKMKIAMTGIVLIKDKYALAHADDVVKIPQTIFKSDSRAVFFAAKDTPWFAKPASYVAHPEYEYSTLNSIAVVVLDLDEVNDFPLNPICIPSGKTFNTSRYLYLTGFTDENKKLEKVFYKIQYLDKKVCEEFYSRAGLSASKRVPNAYLCGYAPSNLTQCVWDSGMVLVSNVTGYFYLIGFGTHGPGCGAPARFIDLFPYFYWINSVISPNEVYDDGGFRRSMEDDDEFTPVHKLFTDQKSLRKYDGGVVSRLYRPYSLKISDLGHHVVTPTLDDKILIYPFYDEWEMYQNACTTMPKVQIYKEVFQVNAATNEIQGAVEYKLSIYDKNDEPLNCVRLSVTCKHPDAELSFKEVMQFKEPNEYPISGETPEELFQFYPGLKRTVKPGHGGRLVPAIINDDKVKQETVLNYDLFIKFKFRRKATLEFEMFSEPGSLDREDLQKWKNFKNNIPFIRRFKHRYDYYENYRGYRPVHPKYDRETLKNTTTNVTKTTTTAPWQTARRRAKTRVKGEKITRSGVKNWADNMLMEAEVSVREEERAARGEAAPGAVVMAGWLIACLSIVAFSVPLLGKGLSP